MLNRLNYYNNWLLRYYFLSKYNVRSMNKVPKLNKIVLTQSFGVNVLPSFLFFFIMTGLWPKVIIYKTARKKVFKAMQVTSHGHTAEILINKILNFAMPYTEELDLTIQKKTTKNLYNLTFSSLVTYKETENVYSQESQPILKDFHLNLNILLNSGTKSMQETLLRMFQVPIKIKKTYKKKRKAQRK